MTKSKKIDVAKAIRSKYKGWVPRPLIRWLQKLIHEDELNHMMELQHHVGGVEMAHNIMEYLGITTEIVGAKNLPSPDTRTLFVSNHPLGGADGVILTALLGDHYQGNIRFLVNDLLMAVYQFGDVFVPVNKYGSQGRERALQMGEALESNHQVITFPAGLCSRKREDGSICDLNWNSSFLRMAHRSGRTICPLFFDGVNSPRFYKWARRREKLKIKFNYELILLPDELMRAKGKHYRIYVGQPFTPTELPSGRALQKMANSIRDELYLLPQSEL